MGKTLPNNWVETVLGEVTTKPQYGWTSKAGNIGSIKYLRTTDLSKGKVDWSTVPFCLDEPDDISKYQVEDNDILISRAGSIGLSYRISNPPQSAVFASYLIRFKPLINAKLIEYYLKSSDYWNEISDVSAGIAVQNVNAPKLSNLCFPLPPLPEQERIANKLDALFSQLDGIRAAMERIPTLLKNFRQQVLTQAVTGTFDKNRDLIWGNLEHYKINIITGPFGSSLHQSDYIENGYPVINPSHIINGRIIPNLSVSISKDKFNDLKTWELLPNDVILGRRGEMGRAAKVNNNEKYLCGTGSLILRGKNIDPDFLVFFLRSPFCVNYLSTNSVGSTMINLNQKIIKSLPIPIWNISEQREIVRRVESLFSQADTIEQQYQSLKQKINNLPQAILHKAFKGELVEQLPTDGDARDLLRQIEELKQVTKKKK